MLDNEELEMPTPCQKCGNIFDLNDGYGSEKWFPSTIICKSCFNIEEKEIEFDEEIEDLKNQIDDAEITIKLARERLSVIDPDGEYVVKEIEKITDATLDLLDAFINYLKEDYDIVIPEESVLLFLEEDH